MRHTERGRKLLGQLELQLEELEANAAEDEAVLDPDAAERAGHRPARRKPVQGDAGTVRNVGHRFDQVSHEAQNSGELFNFMPIGGRCLGYVPRFTPSREFKRMNLARLGAPDGAKTLDHVTVVWTATPAPRHSRVVVGWYEDATAYEKLGYDVGHPEQDRYVVAIVTNALDEQTRTLQCFSVDGKEWLPFDLATGAHMADGGVHLAITPVIGAVCSVVVQPPTLEEGRETGDGADVVVTGLVDKSADGRSVRVGCRALQERDGSYWAPRVEGALIVEAGRSPLNLNPRSS